MVGFFISLSEFHVWPCCFAFFRRNNRIGHLSIGQSTGGAEGCADAGSSALGSTESLKSFSTADVGGHEILLIMLKKTCVKYMQTVIIYGTLCNPHTFVSFLKTREREKLKLKDVGSQLRGTDVLP